MPDPRIAMLREALLELTPREREVMVQHYLVGFRYAEIAAQDRISVRTVETHVDNALTKLGLHTRTRLATWVREAGLLANNP